MSAIENYLYAVQRRVSEPLKNFDSDHEAKNGPNEPDTRSDGDIWDVLNPAEREDTSGSTFCRPAHFYFYKSIRFRAEEPGEWGVYVMRGGRDLIAKRFRPYCSSDEEATQTANDFLMACGTAHYRFDVFAMSLEAIQQRWLYVPYRKASIGVNAPPLEAAFVHQTALEWGAKRGLTAPVSGIFELWTANTVLHLIPRRSLGAYLATALAEGFGALPGPARYDQAEWANIIPETLSDECPGPHVLNQPPMVELTADVPSTNPTSEDWLARWGIEHYTRLATGDYRLGESLVIFGDHFPNGKFPVRITEIDGDFVCQETNLSTVAELPTSVCGNADISRNRHLRDFHGVNTHLNSVLGGVLRVSEEFVDSAVLGLLKIKGLCHIKATRDAGKPPVQSWAQIASNFLPVSNSNRAVPECQEALVCAGLKHLAKI